MLIYHKQERKYSSLTYSTKYVPGCLTRQRVLELAHGGHQGIVKTKTLIRSRVWLG
jgi:hypothetical protein